LVGDTKRIIPARKPLVVELKTWDIANPELEIAATFTAQDGEVVPVRIEKVDKPECSDGRTGFVQFKFLAPRTGNYVSNIKAAGRDMRKGPLVVVATPSPSAKLISVPDAKQGVPSVLQVTTSNGLTTDDLYLELEDDKGRSVKVPSLFSEDRDDKDRFNCMYCPPISGHCKVRIFYKDDGQEIEGSGASLRIFGKPSIDWDSGDVPDRYFVGVKSTVALHALGHTVDSLDVSIKDSDGNNLEVALEDQGNGIFHVSFTPENVGDHIFDIKADLISVPGLPRTIKVEERPRATYTGPTEIKAVAMKPVRFDLNTVNLATNEVKLNFADALGNGVDLPVKVEDNGNGTFTVEFTPTQTGQLTVQIEAFGEDVGTLNVDVAAPPLIIGGCGEEHRRKARATKLFEFELEGGNISPNEIKVDIKNEKGENLPAPSIKETQPGRFTVGFVPPLPGSLKIGVWPCYADAESLFVDVAPMAQFIGDTNQVATATKPFTFALQGAEGISLSDIGVQVRDTHGNEIAQAKISDKGDGTYSVEFTPMDPGRIEVHVSTCGDFFDTPLSIKVRPCASLLEGESNKRKAAAGRPFSFDLQGQKGLKAKNIAVAIESEEGSSIDPPIVTENPDGTFTVTFVPPKPDQLKVSVSTHGDLATQLDVTVVPTCHLPDDLSLRGYASLPVKFPLKADPGLLPSDVHVDVKDKEGNTIPFKVTDNGDGTFQASFTPARHGDHTVVVSAHGLPISAPLTAEILPLAQFSQSSLSAKHRAIATKPFSFDLDALSLKPEDVKVDIINERGERLPDPSIKDNKDGTFTATFTPMEHGDLKIHVSTKGVRFDGHLDVAVAPIARFVGDTERSTTATKLFDFQLHAPNLSVDDVVVDIEGKVGGVLPHPQITDNRDGTFHVAFTPMECDELTINVTTKGEKFDTPLKVHVAPIASFIGGTKRVGTATKPVEFSLSAKHGIKPEDVSFEIIAEDGSKLPPPTIVDAGNDVLRVSFTPAEPGELKVHVSTKGVKFDTPLEVHVRPTAKFLGGGRRFATATKPFDFSLAADQLKISDVAVTITDEKGNKLPDPSISDNGDGTFTVAFTPMDHGLLNVTVATHGEAIGAPMEVEVAPIARFVGDLERTGHSTKPFEFTLDAPLLTPEDVTVNITNEKGYSLPPPTITDNKDGTFTVSFVPMDPCQLTVNVTTKGEEFDTPMHVNVLPTAKWKTPSVLPARATIPVTLKLAAEAGLTVGDLQVNIKYENGTVVDSELKDNGDGTISLTFVPPVDGNLEVSVLAHGDPIGDPTKVIVAPAPSARFPPGPPVREATQTKTFSFPLDIVSVFPNELKVTVGDEEVEIKVNDLRDGTFNVSFVPMKVGSFPVKVSFLGQPVEGDPFTITVDPKPDVTGVSKLDGARVAKPFDIVLQTVNLKPDQVEVKLIDSDGKHVKKYKLKEKGADKMVLTWTPTVPGEHCLDLVVDGHECPGLPAKFPVAPKPHATLVGDKKRKGVEGKLFEFQLNTVNLRPEDIRIEMTDDKGEKIFREDALVAPETGVPDVKKTSSSASLKSPRIGTSTHSPRTKGAKRAKGGKGKEKDSEKGKESESESLTPRGGDRDYSQPAVAVDVAGLKGLLVPGDIIVAPPEVSQQGDQFTISYVPWKAGKFDVKVTFEDVVVDLQVTAAAKPKTNTVETLDQLGLNAGFKNIGDEKELLKRIKKLREELINGYTRNNQLQEKHKEIEKTISLLVRNHTSIVAIDRARKKKQQGNASSIA
jgi:filamin